MEYHKIINLLDNTPNQLFQFRTKIWVETNGESWGAYKTNNDIKFKNLITRSSLYEYSNEYIHVTGTLTIPNNGTAEAPNNINKKVIFKNCATLTDCISKINETHVNDANYIDVAIPMIQKYQEVFCNNMDMKQL